MSIIITGASRGLGAAITKLFAAQHKPTTFLLCARNAEQLNNFAKQLQLQYPDHIFKTHAANLANIPEAQSFAAWCLGFGTPKILVNNAGSYVPGNVHNEAPENLPGMISTNLYSCYYVTQGLVEGMKAAKQGHIINISSIAGQDAYNGGGSYSVSKFAMTGFSKNLRSELMPYQVKVTTIYPGAAFTDAWAGSGVPEHRIMEAADVAAMVFAVTQLSVQACVEEIVMRPVLGDL